MKEQYILIDNLVNKQCIFNTFGKIFNFPNVCTDWDQFEEYLKDLSWIDFDTIDIVIVCDKYNNPVNIIDWFIFSGIMESVKTYWNEVKICIEIRFLINNEIYNKISDEEKT